MMMPQGPPEIEGLNFLEMIQNPNRNYFVSQPGVGKGGIVTVQKAIGGKRWALFLSSDDCPACESFREVLKKTYVELKRQKKDWEVVELMFSRNLPYFEECRRNSPWPFVPFSDGATRQQVAQAAQLSSVPQLYLNDEEGVCMQADGVSVVKRDGAYGYPFEPWRPTLMGSVLFGGLCFGVGALVWYAVLQPMFQDPNAQPQEPGRPRSRK